jgi:hypothetical protein
VEHKYILSTIVTEELRWVHGGKGQVAQQDMVKTTMTGPDTGFLQPIKFQEMGATTQHQCRTQIYPIYNHNRGIEVGPWREGPSSTTGQGENHPSRPRRHTGFFQPIKFQKMGATTQHQCGTQI